MPIEAALIKPIVDALMALFRQGSDLKLKHNAETALREAIRELLLANPDENRAAARIAIAKAAGILSEDIVLAEDMLNKHRATRARTSGKSSTGRKRKPLATPDKPEKPEKPEKSADKSAGAASRPARKPAKAASRKI